MTTWRFAVLTFVGMLLTQAAWILAVPPFGGIDEFDHVHRAAGAASGQWRLALEAENGRGRVVAVPQHLVDAASAQCAELEYTGDDNCFPIEVLPGDRVKIATAAGQYHPLYYALVGYLAKPFEGANADYAMRVVSALACSIGVGLAALALSAGGAGKWTRFGFIASLTPVLIYTTSLPAPNGPEIVAGLCLWTSLLGLLRRDMGARWNAAMLLLATLSASALAVLRMLGPMWLGLIVVTVAVFSGIGKTWKAIGRSPRLYVLAALVVTAAVLYGSWWTSTNGMTQKLVDSPSGGEVSLGAQPLVWIFQIVGAFPRRADPAPMPVYAFYVLVVGAMVVAALWRTKDYRRWTILASAVIVASLPVLLTYATADTMGVIWQGRYGLAFVVGILIMGGTVLDESNFAQNETNRLVVLGWSMVAAAHVWSVAHVYKGQTNSPVALRDESWITVPLWIVAGLSLLGLLALLAASRPSSVMNVNPRTMSPGAETIR